MKKEVSESNKVIAARINQLIDSNRLSKREFASLIGITEQSVGNYTNGRRVPPADVLIQFKKSLEYLLIGCLLVKNISRVNCFKKAK